MDVLEHLGYERLNYFDACKYRNSPGRIPSTPGAVFEEYAASPYRAKGPVVVDSRYISEDVPQGLVMLESLGRHLSIPHARCVPPSSRSPPPHWAATCGPRAAPSSVWARRTSRRSLPTATTRSDL